MMADLIDRQAVRSKMLHDIYDGEECGAALDIIDAAPDVEAVEVVHGRWVSRNDYEDNYPVFACSVCDIVCAHSNNDDDTVTLYRTKYCPNCGAKMDKEGET